MATPLVIFGDAPGQTTGLARIAGDLTGQLHSDAVRLDLDVRSVGYVPWTGLPLHGMSLPQVSQQVGWPVWGFSNLQHWGLEALSAAYRHWFGEQKGIVLTVWDPGRCFALLESDLPVSWWGYFAVDAHNMHGELSGPAKEVLTHRYDRVLAYGPYGATVLGRTLGRDVEWLPHGINPEIFTDQPVEPYDHRARAILGRVGEFTTVVGCVATNMPRKDLGAWALIARQLHQWEFTPAYPLHFWLHVDQLVTEAWSVPQLIEDAGLTDCVTVTTTLKDQELAGMYRRCAITIAPGRGEGFGYPILESLACGTPVVHVDYAGGADILRGQTPTDWIVPGLVPPIAYQLTGPYALQRPVLDWEHMATAAADLITRVRRGGIPPNGVSARAAMYRWPGLWPQWRAWVQRGLSEAHT